MITVVTVYIHYASKYIGLHIINLNNELDKLLTRAGDKLLT